MSGASRALYETITLLLKALFEREEANLVQRENQLIDKNAMLGGTPDGFRHLGLIYSHLTGRMRSMGSYGLLKPELVPEMDRLLAEKKTIQSDKDWIRQGLVLTLRDCHSSQDIRDTLPNGLKEFVPNCSRLERTRPEAFTLADNPKAYAQYMQLREKIEFYVAARLLY